MANRFLNNVKINDAYTLPETIGTTGQYIKLTDAGTGTTAWADLGQATEVSTISYEVRNETGSSIPVGSVVYVNGGSGSSGHVTIALSDASSEPTSSKTFGITAETIANNSIGKVVLEGIVEGLDTSSYSPGQTLWLSTTAGEFTNPPPTTPDHSVFVGYAVRCQQNNGSIFVKIQNGYELGEIHDVKITSVADNQLITYDSALGYWVNSNDLTLSGLHIDSTGAVEMPTGTDGQRPTGIAGMFRFNTTSNQFEGYNGTAWGAIAGSGGGTSGQGLSIERDVFTATANQTVFTISSDISSSSNTQVYIDGVYQAKSNYTTSGSTVTFSTGVPAGAEVEVVHFISVFSKIYTDTFTGDNTTVNFTASKDVTDENVTQVYIDGVYQSKDNYTTSGTTITFSTAPPSGSAVEVVHFTALDYSTIASNQFTGTGSQTDFTLTQEVDVDKAFVFIQGVYQEKSTYSISGTTLTFTTAPLSGYTIEVITIGGVSVFSDTLYVDTFTGTGSQVDYTLSSSPASVNAIDVYLNGIYQNKSNFSVSGSTLTFSTAPTAGTAIEVKSTGGLNNVLDNVVLTSGTGISITENSKNNFTISNTLIDTTVSYNTPTGQSLTYTTPSQSTGQAGSVYGPQTFTMTRAGYTISGTATISGLPSGLTIDSQSYDNSNPENTLTITLGGVFPSANSLNNNLVISGLTVTRAPVLVDYLVVAGGGGGGGNFGGGGGGGGLRTSYTNTSILAGHTESAIELTAGTNYTVEVGTGGAAGSGNSPGTAATNGGDSIFATITSKGGGAGANVWDINGYDGGCGGGAGTGGSTQLYGGLAVTSPVVHGYRGGNAYDSMGSNAPATYKAGGGGGAGGQGQDVGYATSFYGTGGVGLAVNILDSTNATTAGVGQVSGSDVYYSGGGGSGNGYSVPGTGGAGGLGGGGRGGEGNASANPLPGTANTGGGGGGGGYNIPNGADGGSGVIIIKYSNLFSLNASAGLSYSSFTDGAYNIEVFTAGTGTISFS